MRTYNFEDSCEVPQEAQEIAEIQDITSAYNKAKSDLYFATQRIKNSPIGWFFRTPKSLEEFKENVKESIDKGVAVIEWIKITKYYITYNIRLCSIRKSFTFPQVCLNLDQLTLFNLTT